MINVLPYIVSSRDVVIEIREGDKVLAWASFTPAQARQFAANVDKLAEIVQCMEAHEYTAGRPRFNKEEDK